MRGTATRRRKPALNPKRRGLATTTGECLSCPVPPQGAGKLLFFTLCAVVIFIYSEDLIRRMLPGRPPWVVLAKTAMLGALAAKLLATRALNDGRWVLKWLLVVAAPLVFHVSSQEAFLRAALWFNAAVAVPILCIVVTVLLSPQEFRKLCLVVFGCTAVAAMVAGYSYISGAYASPGHLLGPAAEDAGYRFYGGQRLYFNAGWFYGAERLTWCCAVGIAAAAAVGSCYKESGWATFWLLPGAFFVWVASTSARVTGLAACAVLMLVCSVRFLISRGAIAVLLVLLGVLVATLRPGFLGVAVADKREYYLERSQESGSRVQFHIESIKNAVAFGNFLGFGPMPQGAQYIDKERVDPPYHTEGLVSHAIAQFGVLSILDLSYHAVLMLFAVRALGSPVRVVFPAAALLLVTRLWLLKASQMETDTFAQASVYLLLAPLLRHGLAETEARSDGEPSKER